MHTTTSRKGIGAPKTPEGKRRVSINALKHGLNAESQQGLQEVARMIGREFEDILCEMLAHYQPADPIEELLARCSGQVTYSDTSDPQNKYLIFNDGSGRLCSGHAGVKVLCANGEPSHDRLGNRHRSFHKRLYPVPLRAHDPDPGRVGHSGNVVFNRPRMNADTIPNPSVLIRGQGPLPSAYAALLSASHSLRSNATISATLRAAITSVRSRKTRSRSSMNSSNDQLSRG